MRSYCWKIPDAGGNGVSADGTACFHTVTCTLSRLRGKLLVTVDGDEYTLPAGFLGLSAARREMFQLGQEKALLVLDRSGHARLTVEGQPVEPEN